MEYKYKLSIGSEVYSKKNGMVLKWYTDDELFTTPGDVLNSLKEGYLNNKVQFDSNSTTKGTIYRYPNGIASHKRFKIMRVRIKDKTEDQP